MIKEVTKNDSAVRLYNWDNMPQDKEIYLYKILPYKYLLDWIYKDSMSFNQVSSWEDVYELFLFKQNYIKNSNPVDFKAASMSIYGQSWSLQKDLDALWRIYSSDKLSVRIKTTFSLLKKALENSNAMSHHIGTYLGRVEYMRKNQIIERLKDVYVKDIFSEQNIVDSLFVKRDAFSYEREIRIILWQENDVHSKAPNPIVSINVHPADFIKEVAFDYRLDDGLYTSLKSALQIMLPKVKIQKSKLGIVDVKTYNI